MIIQAQASSESLKQINKSLKQEGGVDAASFVLAQRYIEAFKKLAKEENTIVLPGEPNKVDQNVKDSVAFFKS